MKRKRLKNFITFAEVLGKTSGRFRIKIGLMKYSLWDNWKKIMPKTVSDHTTPVRWNNNVLVVGTTTSTWVQELTYLKPELLDRIKRYQPKLKIKDIYFETGHTIFDNTKEARQERKKQQLSDDSKKRINEWTKDIDDDDLKNSIQNALVSVLKRSE